MRSVLIDFALLFAIFACVYAVVVDPAWGEQLIYGARLLLRSGWWALQDFFN